MVHIYVMGFMWMLIHMLILVFINFLVHNNILVFICYMIHVSGMGFISTMVHRRMMGFTSHVVHISVVGFNSLSAHIYPHWFAIALAIPLKARLLSVEFLGVSYQPLVYLLPFFVVMYVTSTIFVGFNSGRFLSHRQVFFE
mgnify:CR=1 FL=1